MIIACGGITDPGLVAEVKLLATVAAQDVEDDGAGGVRIAQRLAPERVISTVDPVARHGHRSRRDRYDGYKLHVSVDIDSDLLIAGRATTATTGDGEVLKDLLEDDPVAVAEVIGDTNYGSAQRHGTLAEDRIELTAPAQPSSAAKGHFRTSSLSISRLGPSPARPDRPRPSRPPQPHAGQARFDAKVCATCPLRDRCTKRTAGAGSSKSTTTNSCSSPPAKPAGLPSSANVIENGPASSERTPS